MTDKTPGARRRQDCGSGEEDQVRYGPKNKTRGEYAAEFGVRKGVQRPDPAKVSRDNEAYVLYYGERKTLAQVCEALNYHSPQAAHKAIARALRRSQPRDINKLRLTISGRLWKNLHALEAQAIKDALGDSVGDDGKPVIAAESRPPWRPPRRDCRLLDRVLALYAQLRGVNGVDAKRKSIHDTTAAAPQAVPLEIRQQKLRSMCEQTGLVAIARAEYLRLLHLAEIGKRHEGPKVLEYVNGELRPVEDAEVVEEDTTSGRPPRSPRDA
jgi:hypothetical protein